MICADSALETVAHAQRTAKRTVPSSVYWAIVAGSEQNVTLSDNVRAFEEIKLRPRLGSVAPKRELTTTVLGRTLSMPILISPTGTHAIHPDGELAVARAAAAAGTAMGLSMLASQPVEDIAAICPNTYFQLYWTEGRDRMAAQAERAKAAGCAGLILTLDYSLGIRRDRGRPYVPDKLNAAALVRFAPELARRPRYVARWLRSGSGPSLLSPNFARSGAAAPTFLSAMNEWARTPSPTWDDVAWLRDNWEGPFLIKGVLSAEDARHAVDTGATAVSVSVSVSVSNHGGNTLDSAPATIRILPEVVDAVGSQVEVLLDAGIRRGGDVAKALALGAKSVLIGRAYLWGLAARGEAGVRDVLEILRSGLDHTMAATGARCLADLDRSALLMPDDVKGPSR